MTGWFHLKASLHPFAGVRLSASSPRCMHCSHRRALAHRASQRYAPTIKSDAISRSEPSESLRWLLRGGFIRQSSPGVWTLLPNGLRVVNKVEHILDEEMERIGASKLSLPHLQASAIWEQSGRWRTAGGELFRVNDRKDASFALAPTHEEEVTSLVAQDIKSAKQLPVKVYQTGRKYRDEMRPRFGLLRSKEFIMKDLYTFDATPEAAMKTYAQVREAYDRIFRKIGVPFMVAEADSGNIGGSLSHEYQFVSPSGEDSVITCTACSYTANAELAVSHPPLTSIAQSIEDVRAHAYASAASNTLVAVLQSSSIAINPIKLRQRIPDVEPVPLNQGSVQLDQWDQLQILLDSSCASLDPDEIHEAVEELLHSLHEGGDLLTTPLSIWPAPPRYDVADLRMVRTADGDGDLCIKCRAPLKAKRAIEVGHTFYLGTKYSKALRAGYLTTSPAPSTVVSSEVSTTPPDPEAIWKPFEMGCYGIGVSRLLGAIAECSATSRGICWPTSVAPYRVCLVVGPRPSASSAALALAEDLEAQGLTGDVLIDDRHESVGWKLSDAEVVGYPVVVVLAKHWEDNGEMEVRNQRTGDRKYVGSEEAAKVVSELVQVPEP